MTSTGIIDDLFHRQREHGQGLSRRDFDAGIAAMGQDNYDRIGAALRSRDRSAYFRVIGEIIDSADCVVAMWLVGDVDVGAIALKDNDPGAGRVAIYTAFAVPNEDHARALQARLGRMN